MEKEQTDRLKVAAKVAVGIAVAGYGSKLIRKSGVIGYVQFHKKGETLNTLPGFIIDILDEGKRTTARLAGSVIFGRNDDIEDLVLDDHGLPQPMAEELEHIFTTEVKEQ